MVSYIEDKVFVVTGGAAGVGAGVVRNLLTEGARFVAFFDIRENEGALLEAELLRKFGALRAKFFNCDISDDAQLSAAFRHVIDKFYRLDVVINNAAVVDGQGTAQRIIDVNLTATINSSLKALDIMSAGQTGGDGGVIVNISSLIVLSRVNVFPIYAAAKAGVLQFSNAIGAPENYSKTKVRVLTVCLGPTDTAILHRSNVESLDKDCSISVTPNTVKQRVESAVTGITEVIKYGESGSTWMIADDQPAKNITKTISDGYDSMYHSILGR